LYIVAQIAVKKQQIENGIKNLVKGEVLFDKISREIYSTAACIFQEFPLGCVVPRDEEDVAKVLAFCYKNNISLTPRGAGSSVAGQALGSGIIIDFSQMNKILEVNPSQQYARVQPGVVLSQLNSELEKWGLWFPPDPSSSNVCTIGGMIANNSSGAHSVKYGSTKDYVLELKVIFDNGDFAWISSIKTSSTVFPKRYKEILRDVSALLKSNSKIICESRLDVPKNSSGYNIFDIIGDDVVNLHKLIVGSEGTLAVVVEAKIRIIKLPCHRGFLEIGFDNLSEALKFVPKILSLCPSVLEFIDKTVIDLAKGWHGFKNKIPQKLQTAILIEFDGDDINEIKNKIYLAKKIIGISKSAIYLRKVTSRESELVRIRKMASSVLDRMNGPLRSTRLIEDACVKPFKIGQYITGLKSVLGKLDISAVIFGHAGSGNMHVNVLLNPHNPNDNKKIKILLTEVSNLVCELGGSLSGEHGDGLLRKGYLKKEYPKIYHIFRGVKNIFDPKGILNPGKKLSKNNIIITNFLRGSRRYRKKDVDKKLPFANYVNDIEVCNGCGECRSFCPLFLEKRDERTTPRAKANILIGFLEGRLELDDILKNKEFLRDISFCLKCKICQKMCPAGFDIVRLGERLIHHPKN